METPLKTDKDGSTLIITLLVVGLMLIAVLAMATHVRLEMRAVQSRYFQALANKNAVLALDLAVSRLQETAGPDQRVTATAGSLGNLTHESKKWLTGIWDTRSGAPTEPAWLVSTADAPGFTTSTEMPPNSSVVLVGSGTQGIAASPATWVRAPYVTFTNGGKSGRYSWWVGDEGVKASLALPNPFDNPAPVTVAGMHETEIRRLRYAVPVRNAQEFAFSSAVDFENPLLNPLVGRLIDLNHFSFIGTNENPENTGGFHDYTLNARGLLTHPIDGGVKVDLSQAPEKLGDGFVRYMDFPSYMEEPTLANFLVKRPEDLRRMHFMVPPDTFNPTDGDIVHSVVPIITDFGLQFSPHRDGSNAQALISMRFLLELWNPYSSGLVEEDLILEITGLQPITMNVGGSWERTFSLVSTFGEPLRIRLNRNQHHTNPNPLIGVNAHDANAHGPGRLLYWTGPSTANPQTASFGSRTSTNSRLTLPAIPAASFPNPSTLQVRYKMPVTRLTITLRRAPENGGEVLARHDNFEYESVDSGSLGTLANWTQRWLTFRFRMFERGTTYAGDRSLWMKHRDKRSPTLTFGDSPSSDSHIMHEAATSYSPDDTALKNDLNVRQDQEFYYFDRILSMSAWSTDTRRDISLFELPRQPLISIGQLQHLHIAGYPPHSIGNPWGGSKWNRLFDDYFLSGAQNGISMPDFSVPRPILPHPRISFVPPGDIGLVKHDESTFSSLGGKSAVALQVEGQFNLNSVSPEAWQVVLGGSIFPSFTHTRRDTNLHDATQTTDSDIVTGNSYPNGFTRFPQSIQELFDVDVRAMDRVSGDANDRNIRTMKAGITFLHPRTGVAGTASDYNVADKGLLLEFAGALAEGIQTRNQTVGRPYFSMTEFITETYKNGNPLLETILSGDVSATKYPRLHAGELRSYTAPVNGTLVKTPADERSPAWLSQADILSAISPFLSTRSDTFTIRTYGDVLDPTTGAVLSKAWCEALVQRTVRPLNPVSSLAEMADNPASSFGRRFKIISFRWLRESDI